MDQEVLSQEILVDLFRSAWLVETSRARLYRVWAETDRSFAAESEISDRRADIVAGALGSVDQAPDSKHVEAHTEWMARTAGRTGEEVPLGAVFISRLGTWVDAHVADFLPAGGDEMKKLGEQERATLRFPNSMPTPPPFEPLVTPEVTPPGSVRFRFAILADLHFGSRQGDALAEAAISDINASGAELVVQLGDITDHGQREEFDKARKALERIEAPLVTMMGNHDVLSIKEEKLTGREYYAGAFGREADGVVVEHNGMRFAVLDSVEHAASPLPAFDFVAGRFVEANAGAIVRGSLPAAQHEILAQVAEPDSLPAFIFLHHPPQPFLGFPPILFGLRDADTGRLHATLDSGNVWGVFAGHTHRNARTRDFDGVPAHEVAIPRDYPFGYGLVDVTDRGYAYRFVQLSDKKLVAKADAKVNPILRRYARGSDDERAFVWEKP
jgi:hypothetical protein